MPLEDAQAIDRLETLPNGGLRLVIVDTGQTTDPTERLDALLAKLRTYVGYCLSDDFVAKHPGVSLADVTILVESPLAPTADMAQIHEVGPEGDRSRVVRVEYAAPEMGATTNRSKSRAAGPLDRLTPARLKQLRIVPVICVLAGMAVFAVWVLGVLDARRLERDGVMVEGRVLGASLLQEAYGRNKYKLPVQYAVIDEKQAKRSIEKTFLVLEDVYEQARVTGTIEVRYLPDDPSISDVESHNPTPMNYLATAAELWVVGAVGGFVLWRLEKRVSAASAQVAS